jgi:hypothetical protein
VRRHERVYVAVSGRVVITLTHTPGKLYPTGLTSSDSGEQVEELVELAERVSSDVMDASVDIVDALTYLNQLRQAIEELGKRLKDS